MEREVSEILRWTHVRDPQTGDIKRPVTQPSPDPWHDKMQQMNGYDD